MKSTKTPQRAQTRSVLLWAIGGGILVGWAWAAIDFAIAFHGGLKNGVLLGWALAGVLAAAIAWTRARGVGVLRAPGGRIRALLGALLALLICWVVAAVGLLSLWAMAFSGSA